MNGFLNRFVELVQSYGIIGLISLSFAESSFFPIPPDVLLLPMAFMNRSLAILYALLTTLSSTLGGIFGHFLGRKFGKPLLKKLFKEDKIEKVENYFNKYGGWAVGIAGFTPIPYKIFTISAGAFGVRLSIFTVSSLIGRGARFFLEGLIIFFFGDTAKFYLTNYFEIITISLTLFIALIYYIVRKVSKGKNPLYMVIVKRIKRIMDAVSRLHKRYKKYDEAAFILYTSISISFIMLFSFLELSDDYFERGSWAFDIKIMDMVLRNRNQILNKFFIAITSIGNFNCMFILTIAVMIILAYKNRKKLSLYFAINTTGVWIFNELLKIIFKRTRPTGLNIIKVRGYSFPSGHAMIFLCWSIILIYILYIIKLKKEKFYLYSIVLIIISFAVGISRIYLGVHYPSDVVAGWISGMLWASSSIAIHRMLMYKGEFKYKK
ncbi:undecaprenyl-diphosphatase [Caloramator quimbayensis]|uniref:Undecaprenyl-diphosphatase n=1 Tax=Caloramator quimbayensis TaxID=1147123 RepID=A0A1T4XAD5_9CLOT|nr:phosphatase PAP2 family protein [Caloramator quimbayensis]SKA86075.1 undecaprenyl-diphosphatase [Caloramator quimbayensis]